MKRLIYIILIAFTSCSLNEDSSPPDITVEQLLSASDTIYLNTKKIFMTTYIWRDFQPISPPDGKPMNIIIYINSSDSSSIQGSYDADAIWVVYCNQIWKSWLSDEPQASNEKNQIVKIARNGPKWGPNAYVDVIVRLYDNKGNPYLLKATKQWIYRTD